MQGASVRWDGRGGKRLSARLEQIGWVLFHKWDLAADFRAVYHLSWGEAIRLPAPEFFALAYRASCYPGVMQARAAIQKQNETRNMRPNARIVQSERSHLLADENFRDVIDFG